MIKCEACEGIGTTIEDDEQKLCNKCGGKGVIVSEQSGPTPGPDGDTGE